MAPLRLAMRKELKMKKDITMSDADLDKALAAYQAPAPSDLLKARILKAAAQESVESPAQIAQPSFMRRFAPIAATVLAVCAIGFTAMQQNSFAEDPDAAIWQEAALNLGLDDIYAWVEDTP